MYAFYNAVTNQGKVVPVSCALKEPASLERKRQEIKKVRKKRKIALIMQKQHSRRQIQS